MARPWGTSTAWVALPEQSRQDYDLPSTSTGEAAAWNSVEWQRNLADAVCHYRGDEP